MRQICGNYMRYLKWVSEKGKWVSEEGDFELRYRFELRCTVDLRCTNYFQSLQSVVDDWVRWNWVILFKTIYSNPTPNSQQSIQTSCEATLCNSPYTLYRVPTLVAEGQAWIKTQCNSVQNSGHSVVKIVPQ